VVVEVLNSGTESLGQIKGQEFIRMTVPLNYVLGIPEIDP